MAFASKPARFSGRDSGRAQTLSPAEIVLRQRTDAFCVATTFRDQTTRLIELFAEMWLPYSDRAFQFALTRWVTMLEQDPSLRTRFRKAWQSTVASLDSVGLFAESGLPAQQALLSETLRRVFRRFLPMAREEADTGRLFASVFASPRAV